MSEYYRVKEDNFMWKEGAILKNNDGAVRPIEDIWDASPVIDSEYISHRIIECPSNAKYFERVYPDSISGKLYKTKDQLINLYKETFIK